MANQEFNIRLEGGGPWGFRLTGGKDFCSPLTVSKITPGGKASYNGLREGDTIVSINYEDTRNMSHMDAQDAIKNTGNTLDLSVLRGDNPQKGRAPLTKTEVVHSAKVDHKYNAIPKPFGAPAYQPPKQSPGVQSAPSVRTGPPPTAPKPSSPMAPAYSHYTGGPARSTNPHDQTDYNSDAALRAKKKEIEEEMLSQRFKLAISDDGEVNYDEETQVPNWGNPPDPNVQSKSFKMLQRHLQKHEDDDDLPPPPPEAYEPEDDHRNIQSKSFQMLQSAVDSGETPPSVFSRDRGDRPKPSTTPMPTRPVMPIQKSQPEYSSPPPPSRPGQAPPVALPGMAIKEPSSGPNFKTQRPHAPSYNHHNVPSAPNAPRAPPGPTPSHQEIKRQPIKPPQPADGSRTPYCDACGEEIFGPFVSAIGRSWHPDHFTCAGCGDSLQSQGFVEEGGKLYCEKCYNRHFAPQCHSCKQPIIGPCVQAIGKTYHPEHFTCNNCGKQIGSEGFNVDRGMPYCEPCYKDMFCIKCAGCRKAIGGGDRWVEAIGDSWHAHCFKCSNCSKPLEGNQFYAHGGKPYCVLHGAA
ncbi:PDZ and LIM domain protein 7 isoform X2 [Exaiptasia diaphana]|uniref:Uncharacterized protein n=1 Tax=Exaiptasia diaphana TaxID=2652724 RepID=A0A913WTC2_EXADI|nr:PDZ and LIM domain protein 7 isoform X2 [Exaiptasia diaphana]